MAKTGRRRPGGSDRNVGPRLGLHRPIRPSKSNAGPRELPLPLIRLRGAAGMVGPWGQRRMMPRRWDQSGLLVQSGP